MNSRYNYMKESSVQDQNGYCFPDPLSLNMMQFRMSTVPTPSRQTSNSIRKFWTEAYSYYNTCEWDDLVLSLNGVPHKNLLTPDSVVLFPAVTDIVASFS